MIRSIVALVVSSAAVLSGAAHAKELAAGADPIAFMKGEWVSRFEEDTARIIVDGRTIRFVQVGEKTSGTLKFYRPGEIIATISSVKSDGNRQGISTSLREVKFNAVCNGITGAERTRYEYPCEIMLTPAPPLPLKKAKNKIGVSYTLSVGNINGFYMADEKQRLYEDYHAYSAGR